MKKRFCIKIKKWRTAIVVGMVHIKAITEHQADAPWDGCHPHCQYHQMTEDDMKKSKDFGISASIKYLATDHKVCRALIGEHSPQKPLALKRNSNSNWEQHLLQQSHKSNHYFRQTLLYVFYNFIDCLVFIFHCIENVFSINSLLATWILQYQQKYKYKKPTQPDPEHSLTSSSKKRFKRRKPKTKQKSSSLLPMTKHKASSFPPLEPDKKSHSLPMGPSMSPNILKPNSVKWKRLARECVVKRYMFMICCFILIL